MAIIDNHPRLNFQRLIKRIQPTNGELKKAQSHMLSCRKRLAASFDVKKVQKIGSHSRSAAIRHHSDLDFLCILTRSEAKWAGSFVKSDTFINKVSQDLNDRFARTTIRKDAQAVVVNFARGQNSLDVVPGIFHSFDKGKPVYSIPDGLGGWMQTSPERHNRFICNEDRRSGSKLSRVSQIIRFWKHSRASNIPISSFHIDLLLASSQLCVGAKSYPALIRDFFSLMADRGCRGLRDPLGIAGVVYAVKTEAQGKALVGHVENSLYHAEKALVFEANKRFREANNQWNIVFNKQFL